MPKPEISVFLLLAALAGCAGPAGERRDSTTVSPSAATRDSAETVDTSRWILRPRRLGTSSATFEEGKRLIETNCGDCMGGSSDSLRLGIDYLLGALEAGHRDTAAVRAALTEGYNAQALVYSRSEAETEVWRDRWREVLRARAPSDTDAQFQLAMSHASSVEQRAGLRQLLDSDSLHRSANGYLGLLLAEADSVDAAIPHFQRVIGRGGTRHPMYQALMKRICGQLATHKRRVPDLDRLCGAPRYGATWTIPTGIAVSDTAGRWCAMFLADSTVALRSGQVMAIVFADSGSTASIRTTVRGRRSVPCHAEFAQQWHGYDAYDLDLFQSGVPKNIPTVGLAIGTAEPWTLRTHRTAVANLFGDNRVTQVHRCAADEGEHFTVWNVQRGGRLERVWHEYYDWGAFVERTCGPGEDGQE